MHAIYVGRPFLLEFDYTTQFMAALDIAEYDITNETNNFK
jgi:hypothetical protein